MSVYETNWNSNFRIHSVGVHKFLCPQSKVYIFFSLLFFYCSFQINISHLAKAETTQKKCRMCADKPTEIHKVELKGMTPTIPNTIPNGTERKDELKLRYPRKISLADI